MLDTREDENEVAGRYRETSKTHLDHLYTDKSVECLFKLGGEIAIIHEMDPDATLQTSLLDALFRQSLLLDRQRQCIDFAAI